MSGSHIGIKIADGSFYPIVDKSAHGKKRLILTTAHENQQTVHVSLYQGDDRENAEYIGTLMVENISPAGQGEVEISLVLGIDESGNLNATATDLGSGEYQSLSVSLQSIDSQNLYEMPDFSLEEDEDEEFAVDYEEEAEIEPETALETDSAVEFEEASEPSAQDSAELGEPVATDELKLDDDFDFDGLDSLDLDAPEQDPDSLDSFSADDDDFTFDSGEDADTAWQAALDADEKRFSEETAEAETAPEADATAGARSSEDEEFDFSLDEEAEPGTGSGLDELDDLGADSGFDLGDLGALDEYGLDEADQAATRPDSETAGAEWEVAGESEPAPQQAESVAAAPAREARMGFTADFDTEPASRGAGVILFLGFVILALAALGFLTYIIFRAIESPAVPPIEAGLSLLVPFRSHLTALLCGPVRRRRFPR